MATEAPLVSPKVSGITPTTLGHSEHEVGGVDVEASITSPTGGDNSHALLIHKESTKRSSTGGAKESAHPLEERATLLSCIRLLDAKKFDALPRPLPRAQDLPAEFFRTPSSGDQVISVSHAWRNQAHPDPTCQKAEVLSELLSTTADAQGADQWNKGGLLFLDFISIPQRPYHPGQEGRTEKEVSQFQMALQCMHEMFFYSDRIIHLPWDGAGVVHDGTERVVAAADLKGASFTQCGTCVQVSAQSCSGTPSATSPGSAPLVGLFDQVVAVDNQPITSVQQVESLLGNNARSVKLRHYPFGLSNQTPADARGWIFLERFITMVKCAMMDTETAKKVVITPSDTIFKEIMDGASRLREASLQDLKKRNTGQLKDTLDKFMMELETKHFSGTSTDKRELERKSSENGDRDSVCQLMRQFVEHLAVHWEAEAAKQQSLGQRLTAVVAATEKILLEWDCFSDECAARLAAASTPNPWPVVLVLLLPTALVLIYVMFPYARPDAEGPHAQMSFWAVGITTKLFLCYPAFPIFLAQTAGIQTTPRIMSLFVVWLLCAVPLNSVIFGGISESTGLFPVPGQAMLECPLLGTFLLLLWPSIPAAQRSSKKFRWRLLFAVIGVTGVLSVFGVVFPLLNALLPHVSTGYQALLVFAYVAAKLGFELMGVKFARLLGADATPVFVYFALVAYQMNLCVAFASVSSWVIVIEQICFDAMENLYHLWSLWRQEGAGTSRQEQYIVASLVLREFVELMVPSSFLFMYNLMWMFRPENSALLCMREDSDIRATIRYFQVDILVNAVISALTYLALLRRGHSPLLLLRGVIATRLGTILAISTAATSFYMSTQHSHFGLDLNFKFLWVTDDTAEWVCGSTWALPS